MSHMRADLSTFFKFCTEKCKHHVKTTYLLCVQKSAATFLTFEALDEVLWAGVDLPGVESEDFTW